MRKIRENIQLEESRNTPIEEARDSGAMMLFGEKYGDNVRVITFDKNYSVELCGGCHVGATGNIGLFKITSETGIASGVRRIEAITSVAAQNYVNAELKALESIKNLFKNNARTFENVASLQEENKSLKKQIEELMAAKASNLQGELKSKFQKINDMNFLAIRLPISDSKAAKTLAYNLEKEIGNAVIVFGLESNGKAQLMLAVSEQLTAIDPKYHAGNLVRELAKEILGGGGGQAFFATAGGKNPAGIEKALDKAKAILE